MLAYTVVAVVSFSNTTNITIMEDVGSIFLCAELSEVSLSEDLTVQLMATDGPVTEGVLLITSC